jgi:[ribosomal protein S5]-alanine N-acetyltransferase
MLEPTLRLALPEDGITDGDVVLRLPTEDDIDGLLVAAADPELREAANMPNIGREQAQASIAHLPTLMASGRMLPMTALDATTGDIVGGGILHHLDAERGIVEIGYWVLPHARRRGMAPKPDGRRVDKTLFSLLPGE